MQLNFKLAKALEDTNVELDGVIRALGGIPFNHPETIATYQGGEISSYNISGDLKDTSIQNLNSVIQIEIGNTVTSIGYRAFAQCSSLTSITIGNSVTSIGEGAFSNCSGLTSIIIPSSVTSIGNYAFHNCVALSSITSYNTSAPTVQSGTFGNMSGTFTGWNTHSSGNNVLKVPQGATGYNSGVWANTLQRAGCCGFHIEYI